MDYNPVKNYTLNHTFKLLGNSTYEKAAETNLLKYLDDHDGKISLQKFLNIMTPAIAIGTNAIFFFDTCTEFSIDCVFNLKTGETGETGETGGTVAMPIDQIYDKTLYNYNQEFLKQTKPDPAIKNAYDQYIEACDKFNLITKQTIYWNLSSQPVYHINYSPIVDIVTGRVMFAFNAIRKNYLDNCVEGSFDMGTMSTIKTFYQVQSSVLSEKETRYTDSFLQKQEVPYLNYLVSLPHVPSNSSSSIRQSIEIPQTQSQSQDPLKILLYKILENVTLFGDHVTSYFKEKKSDDKPIITNGKISEEVSPFVDSAGGGSAIQPMFPDVSVELRLSGKGGSRRRPKNKPKNRKTKKNKKQIKTKNRKNRQPNRNKTRRY